MSGKTTGVRIGENSIFAMWYLKAVWQDFAHKEIFSL
jgi:hypothetical protein